MVHINELLPLHPHIRTGRAPPVPSSIALPKVFPLMYLGHDERNEHLPRSLSNVPAAPSDFTAGAQKIRSVNPPLEIVPPSDSPYLDISPHPIPRSVSLPIASKLLRPFVDQRDRHDLGFDTPWVKIKRIAAPSDSRAQAGRTQSHSDILQPHHI